MLDSTEMTPKSQRPLAAIFRESLYSRKEERLTAWAGVSISDWLDITGWRERIETDPIVVVLNGSEIMECDYGYVLEDGDVLELEQHPRGIEIAGVALVTWLAAGAAVVSAIYTLTMPEPGVPETADVREGSPTYSVSARGNKYRPERKGPLLYGRLRVVPDFDQRPFSTYDVNNDQTLHMIFRITQGRAQVDVSSIQFEDTPLSNFEGVDVEVLQPGEVPTLFPVGVVESGVLSNVELTNSYTSAYVVNEPGTQISHVDFDMSSPSIVRQDKETGDLRSYAVTFAHEVQEIDDNGDAVGGWVELGRRSFVSSNQDALRRTFGYNLEPGRYQARMRRITSKNTSQYVQDTVNWMALKGYLYDPDNTSICTRVAISVRASEQIGNRALSDMSVIATRMLPTWDGELGWQGETPTRSIAWAMADLCRASYAGDRSDLHYDLPRLAELDAQLTPEEHFFDGYYDTDGVTVWDALIKTGTPGRITPIDRSGFYTFVRDEANTQPVQGFTMRNIVRDSFSIQHQGVLEETADSILVRIQDEDNNYRKREILCALPDSPAQNPREIELFGVTNATRAKELGMFMAACNRYRRKLTPFATGIEGRIPFYGSTIDISHWLLGAEGVPQISGDIQDFDGIDKIRVTENMMGRNWVDPHIVMIDLAGKAMPPYPVTILDEFTLQVGGTPDWSQIRFDPGYKEPMFIVGDGQEYITTSKITRIERVDDTVQFEAFIDDPRPYFYGDNVEPPPSVVIPGPQGAAPVLSELQAHVGGAVDAPVVTLSWSLENADLTAIERSDDGGQTWEALGRGYVTNNQYVDRPEPGDYVYRLAAVNLFRGPWVSVQVSTEEAAYSPPLPPENLALREPFTGPVLKLQWDSGSQRHIVEVVVGGSVQYFETIDGLTWDFAGSLAQENGIGRAFTVRVYAVGENGKTSETAAKLAVSNPAPPQLNNLVVQGLTGLAMIRFDWPPGNDITGINVWASETEGFTPGAANLAIDQSRDPVLSVPLEDGQTVYVRVAAVDAWGTSGLNISGEFEVTAATVDLTAIYEDLAELEGKFPITETEIDDDAIRSRHVLANQILTMHLIAQAVTGEKIAALTIEGGHVKANTLTADKTFINQLSAIAADLGMVTAGTFQTTSGTTPRVIISSSGSFPLWIGNGSLVNANNGILYMDNSGDVVFKGQLSVRSATTGERLEINNEVLEVYDSSNTLRVRLGLW